MKVKHFFSFLFVASSLFYACDNKTPCLDCTPSGADFSKGVFVVNEGPFGGTGTISWYDPETGEVQDSLFEKANNGAVLGQFVQSLTFHNGKAYIVVNGANRIVIADATTFEYIDTIGGLALPRYFQPINNDIAFVSQWGLDGVSGSLAKVNLQTNEVIQTIPTGSGPEKMMYFESTKKLYVANSGGFGVDSTVAYIQVGFDNFVTRHVIPGQKNPCCFTRYYEPLINVEIPFYVLCKGDWTDTGSLGWLGLPFQIPVIGSFIPKGSDDLITAANGALYFSSGSAIYQVNSGGISTKLFDQPAYCLATHPVTSALYCADAKDFNSAGEVVIRAPNGDVLGSFRTGISPGEIIFVE